MAKAGLTIAISGTYNGRALEKARQDLEKMKVSAVSELGGAGSSLVDFGAKAAEVGGEIHNIGYKMQQVGSKATSGITVPLAAAATAVGAAAVEMDTSLTNVKKTVDGTEEQYQQLKESAIEFSKTNAVSASQIMDIQSLGAQLGFAIEELDEFGRVVSGLDIATNMDAETAGTELAQFANIVDMGHDKISNYGSAIVGLGNNMATTESDISHMAMRLAAAGHQVGMSEADILGLAAAMSSMGVEAEAGGSAISTIMSQIDKDVARGTVGIQQWADTAGMSIEELIGHISSGDDWAKEFAKSQGMTLKQLSKETIGSCESLETWASTAKMSAAEFAAAWEKDPVTALGALLSGMDEATEAGGNMSLMLEELGIDSIRQTDIMKRMAGNSELVAKAVALSNDEWQKNTALQNEVDNRNASMAARLEILKNKVVAIAEKVGTPLVNALLEVVDAAEPLLEHVSNLAQGFADMDDDTQGLIVRMGLAAAAFGPVVSAAGGLTSGLGDLVVGIGNGAQKFGMLKNEVGLIASTMKGAGGQTLALGEVVAGLGSKELPLVTGALGAVKAAMVGLGIGAAIIAIGAIVGALADWYEHEKKVEEATIGLETAMGAAQEAYDSYSTSTEPVVRSLGDIKAKTDEVLESQGKLAQSMADQWAEYGTNAAMVDAYAQEIQNLTQKYDEHDRKVKLTEEEQTRLKLAVEGYNEATGASIEVIDAANGKLSESTTNILANAEAFKEQARAEAAIEMYKDLYKQQIQDEMALADATDTLNDLKDKEAASWNNLGYNGVNPYSAQVAQAQQRVNELTGAMESNKNTQDQLIGVIMGTGQSFSSFDAALEQSGIKMSDFGTLTDEQLEALRSGFDGKLSSIVTTCSEKGIEIPQSLANAISANKEPVNTASQGLGEDVNAGIQKGIEDTQDKPKSAITTVGDGIIDFFKNLFGIHSPSTVMAELGADIDLGLKQGIEDRQGEPQGAISALGTLLQGAIEGLPQWMRDLGSNAGSLLSDGLSGQSGSVHGAGGTLYTSAEGGVNPVTGALESLGSQAARAFASVIGGTSAYSEGQSLAYSARDGLGGVDTYGTGQNFAWGFANGMGGVDIWGAAWNIGCSALNAIKSALGIASPSKEAAKVGAWFGEGAIQGMRSTERGIAAEATRMSEAMSLNPTAGTYGYARSYQQASQGRQIAFNVTINVTARDEQQAASIGTSIGEQLYLEFARRERAYA